MFLAIEYSLELKNSNKNEYQAYDKNCKLNSFHHSLTASLINLNKLTNLYLSVFLLGMKQVFQRDIFQAHYKIYWSSNHFKICIILNILKYDNHEMLINRDAMSTHSSVLVISCLLNICNPWVIVFSYFNRN